MQLMDKGLEKGKAEGKAEERIHTIKNLINEGLETEFIATVTEATPEYVEEIRQNMNHS